MDERERRHKSMQDGLHSTYMEGGKVSQEFLNDAKEFEELRIDEDEMRRRIIARAKARRENERSH